MSHTDLKFHSAAAYEMFKRSKITPQMGEAEVLALEQRLGIMLPASVREWVHYFGNLRYLSGQDDAFELSKWRLHDDYLLFMNENQYCAFWAVKLDGSDDPPVYYATPRLLEVGRPDWELITDKFSTFTCSRAWSQARVFDAPLSWLTTGGNFEFRAQALLRALYREGPEVNDWPCGDHHHFTNEYAYLWIIGYQWYLGTKEEEDFLIVTSEVWGELADKPDGMSDESRELLMSFQPPAPPGPGWSRIFDDDMCARFADGFWLESPRDRSLTADQWKTLTQSFSIARQREFKRDLKSTHLQRGNQHIYVMTQGTEGYPRRSCWWLYAEDEAALEEVARFACQFGDLRESLRATTDVGKAVLKRMGE